MFAFLTLQTTQKMSYVRTYHSLQYYTKDNMLSIQPGCKYSKYCKLRTIRIFPSVRHIDPTSAIMIQSEVLVIKSFTINAFTCHYMETLCKGNGQGRFPFMQENKHRIGLDCFPSCIVRTARPKKVENTSTLHHRSCGSQV